MGTKLYQQDDQGIRFTSQRRPGDVRIPNYVYDIWLPLLGATMLGVYAMYCRLEREDTVKNKSTKDIAKVCRIGTEKLGEINAALEKYGFIRIRKPEGNQRLMHWTTEYTILDPPQKASAKDIEELSPPSGYEPLAPWLVSPADPGRIADDPEQLPPAALDRSAIVEASVVEPPVVEERAKARAAGTPKPPPTDIYEYRMADEEDHVFACPSCGESVDVYALSRSAAACGCGQAIRVYGWDGGVMCKVPQGMRRRAKGVTDWFPAVRAFCDLANIKYGTLSFAQRRDYATNIQHQVGDWTAEEAAGHIPRLREYVYQIQGLETPRQSRFGDAVIKYKNSGKGGPRLVEWGEGTGGKVVAW